MKKLELSALIALGVMLVFWLFEPSDANAWWTVAFEPLCDGILTAESAGETLVLRSKLLELWQGLFN